MKILILLLFLFFSCTTIKPILIYKEKCDEEKIANYVKNCIPKDLKSEKEKEYYK